jgi:uncharacterized repeat protein (TIGR04076 family)
MILNTRRFNRMFKVRCRLITFEGDVEKFPCHFHYKIGDEFFYDGVHFTGRICPGLFASMFPIIHGVFESGHKFSENIMYRYRGPDMIDPDMKKYDGAGFRPRKPSEKLSPNKMGTVMRTDPETGRARGAHFLCADSRTLANFACEPVDLSDSDYAQPFFRRAIAILEKIETDPGILPGDILEKFTVFEKEEISPRLTHAFFDIMLNALIDINYIEIKNGKAFATGKEPPSRPKIG